jgi:ABC-type sugar transport system ATPase subunit
VTLVTDIVEHPMTAEQALGMVGLDHRLDHFPAQLSGGEQQRVAIAARHCEAARRAALRRADGRARHHERHRRLEALERVNRELGTATVVITHNAAIADMADRVVRLADGCVAGHRAERRENQRARTPMVTMPSRLRALDRKLIRDLWAMKGQSLAIASVIAAGVAMFVTYLSNFDSLQRTRAAYYESARFADVFALLKRAPSSLEARIAALPGSSRWRRVSSPT